ncbi:alpha/beta fold hydrolase [Pedobacter sp. Leaf170]|uniref:alpha/beta fold hydrolase n=1 Tax=Pedobacter sp. Leaf170 TaxID=2876558 RepID=UPI001E55E3ED|nr:alpha/beta hydrolase [Pedobacter sp. Leaf170]
MEVASLINAYFISGLGADRRIFDKIKLDKSINIIHLNWIEPLSKESLTDYAKRLSKVIDQTSPFVLIGVSFGGMLSTEIAKIFSPKATIVISTTILSNQLPRLYRFVGKLNVLKFIPAGILKSSNKLTQNYFFGVSNKEEKLLLTKIVNDTESKFLKWAIGSIITWKNNIKPKNLYHIHGTNDRILYSKNAKPDFLINAGTHFMVYQKADEISAIINQIILK